MKKALIPISLFLLPRYRKWHVDIGLQQRRTSPDIRNKNSDCKVGSCWNKIPREAEECSSVEIKKKLLRKNLQGCAGSVQPYFKQGDKQRSAEILVK